MKHKKLKIGDRVVYINEKYRTVPIGTVGTITDIYLSAHEVMWDNYIFPSGRKHNQCLKESLKLFEMPINYQLEFDFMNK